MTNSPVYTETTPVCIRMKEFACDLPGYRVLNQFYDGIETAVYRAVRIRDNFSVVLKSLKPACVDPVNLARYSNAYRIQHNLQADCVLKAYALEAHEGSVVLIIENFGGTPLSQVIPEWHRDPEAFSLLKFLDVAVQIVEGLISIHAAGIIHKDLRPASIILHPATGKIKIVNFDFAAPLGGKLLPSKGQRSFEGTLAYLSPEQTGRMNRKLDHRTDIYSLGVTFYESLTGRLPFDAADAMELVHAHLARTPTAPHVLNPSIPEALSHIVMKMMAKEQEDRYQSARGLHHDLNMCSQYLRSPGRIPHFVLGRRDRSDYFLVPERLYGRDPELRPILAAFDRIGRGRVEIVLVSGPAGIGKTAIVNEIHEPVVRRHGYFCKGRFDQFTHNVPYSGFVEALRDLMDQALGEAAGELGLWKPRILDALGSSGRILVEVIPELESIIGPQPPVPELSANAAQNRFSRLLHKFIAALTSLGHPIVIFLDDLEWADASSLGLLQQLATDGDLQNLLLVGAYRDNEVSPSHPLSLTLDEMAKTRTPQTRIELGPLEISDINQLIADALSCSVDMAAPLTELVYGISQGNPLFNNELVKSLYTEGLITFDGKAGFWTCDISRATALSLSEDMMQFMAARISRLPSLTQELLKLAACIGATFDLDLLSISNNIPRSEVANALQPAVKAGIVLPQGDSIADISEIESMPRETGGYALPVPVYGFLHERVRLAAYSLIPNDQRQMEHFQIAKILLKNAPEEKSGEKIFEIVNHVNQAVGLITAPAERQMLAELNLKAGQKAKAAMAYRAAREYFNAASNLLTGDCWTGQYDLTLKLHESLVEVACLTGDYQAVDEFAKAAYEKAKSPLDQISIFEYRCRALAGQGRFAESIESGFEILKSLGVFYPRQPSREDIAAVLREAKSAHAGKDIAELLNLPLMSDPLQLAISRILAGLASAAFYLSNALFTYMALKDVVLSFRYGRTPNSAFSYATYGQILCRESDGTADIETGYLFARLAMDLLEKEENKQDACRVHSVVHAFVLHWKDNVAEMLDPLRAAYHTGLETGDFQFGGYSAFLSCAFSYFAGVGNTVSKLRRESESLSDSIRQIGQTPTLGYFRMLQQALRDLEETEGSHHSLLGEYYDGERELPARLRANDWIAVFYIHFHKLLLHYIFGEYAKALQDVEQIKPYLEGMRDFPFLPIFCYYESLARLAAHRKYSHSDPESVFPIVEFNQKRLKIWAQHAPMNCRHKFDLVEAELQRALGNGAQAVELYERAIKEARGSGYLREEALANELAAGFFLERGTEQSARSCMAEAYRCYAQWGAEAKAEQIKRLYPTLVTPSLNSERLPESIPRRYRTELDGTAERTSNPSLDLATVIKASQAVSREIELGPLLKQLIRIVMENAGAQRGALLLERAGEWVIEARGDVDCADIPVLQSEKLDASETVSAAIVSRVAQTAGSVMLGNAAAIGDFIQDAYVKRHGVKSVICAPLINQGKLSGIVYLENNLIANAFTADCLELLFLLSAQMALSLDNARLYQRAQLEIAERKMAEAALRESERRYRTINDSVNDAIIVHEMFTGRILDVNNTACEMYGYTREEMLQLAIEELSSKESPFTHEEALEHEREAEREGVARIFEWRAKKKEGPDFWVEVSTKVAPIMGERRAVVVVRDITERKRAEKALREKTEELNQYFENSLDLLCIADADGHFVRLNLQWEKILGYPLSELNGRCFLDLVHPDDRESTIQATANLSAQKEVLGFVNRYLCRDGSYRWLEWNSFPFGNQIHAVARDITGRKRAEEERAQLQAQLLQAQKLESIGRLAGGVAHDFNNMLSVILGYTELIQTQLPSGDPMLSDVLQIERAGNRAKDVTRQLLAFSRKQIIEPAILNLNDLVASTQKGLVRLIGEDIDLQFCLDPDLHKIKFDQSQLDQILINLAVNARDAMPRGGKLRIETANVLIDEEVSREHVGPKSGEYVLLAVSDTGVGMDEEARSHAFEPFFTTKPVGKGTGLGLATVYGIVTQGGGFIELFSKPGTGSTFKIYFPKAAEDQESDTESNGPIIRPGTGTVLVVEDDAMVRDIAVAMLKASGYRVVAASTPMNAIRYCQDGKPLDLLITDVVMPELSGPALRDKILEIRPGIRVLFISGYAGDMIAHHGVLDDGLNFIRKPFSMSDLAQAVQNAMQR